MYNEKLNELLNKYNDIQKMLIEDLDSEGLNPNDIEFEKMINERSLSKKEKDEIYQFYVDRSKLKTKCYFDELNDIEKSTIEDLLANNLKPDDIEFNQLLNERAVNKDDIYKYFDIKNNEYLPKTNKKEEKPKENTIKKEDTKVINFKEEKDEFVEKLNKEIEDLSTRFNKSLEEDENAIGDEAIAAELMKKQRELKKYLNNKYKNINKESIDKVAKDTKLSNKEKINKLKKQRNWLYELKKLFKKDNLSTSDMRKVGFIDVMFVSIITIILCIIFTFIFKFI